MVKRYMSGKRKILIFISILGLKTLERATYTDKRLSKIHYISHHKEGLARKINNMLDRLLGFDLSSQHVAAENYQLMNYGIGTQNKSVQMISIFFI